MSMNLAFEDRKHNVVDFPYQTRTEISREVMAAKTPSQQMMIIANDIKNYGGSDKWDQEWREESLKMINDYLNDPNYRIVMA